MISFAVRLLRWYQSQHRDLPWRKTRDPYYILVSEIMLQQTRAQTVIPYYHRFLKRFPTARALARASEADVLACWSGLGYYSRARNLQTAARNVVAAKRFPQEYEAIRKLPGVGPYTAAAVASIAFDAPHAALDGNVLRVMSRLTNDAGEIGSSLTRRRLQDQATALLDRRRAGLFNQAMMELGATVCLPRAPLCSSCPVAGDCQARAAGTQNQLPVKRGKSAARKIDETLVVILRKGRLLLWRRPPQAIRMAGFWELPGADQLPGLRAERTIGTFRHTITNNHYTFSVVLGQTKRIPSGWTWYSMENLSQIPLSTTARKALRFLAVS